MKLTDFKNDHLYFHKIKFGKKVEQGLLVQLCTDSEILEEKEEGFRPKAAGKVTFVPTH